MQLNNYLNVSEEVTNALANNKPVVALESTIISHGMPYPKNVETALSVEKIVRENGAVPATIAIIGGKLTVGCNSNRLCLSPSARFFGMRRERIARPIPSRPTEFPLHTRLVLYNGYF